MTRRSFRSAFLIEVGWAAVLGTYVAAILAAVVFGRYWPALVLALTAVVATIVLAIVEGGNV